MPTGLDLLNEKAASATPGDRRQPRRTARDILEEMAKAPVVTAPAPSPAPGLFSRVASSAGEMLSHVFGQPPDLAEEQVALGDIAAEALAPGQAPPRRGSGVTGAWEPDVTAAEAGVSPSELVAAIPPALPGPPVQPGAAAAVAPPPAIASVPSQVEIMRQPPGAAVEGVAAPKIPWPSEAIKGRLPQRSTTMGAAGPDMQVEAARRIARPLPEETFQESIGSLRGLEASRRALNERTVSLNADFAELDRLRGAIEQAPTQALIDAFRAKLATVKPAYEAMAKEAAAISNDAQRAFEAARRSGNRAGIAQAGGLYEWGVSTVQALASLGGSVGTGIQFAASLPGLAGQASTEIGRAQTFPIPGLVKPRPETPVEEMQRGSLEAREAETSAAKDSTEAWVRSRGEIISRYWDDVAKQFPSAYEGRHVIDEPSLLLDPIYLGKGVIQASISMAPSLIMAGGVIRGIQIGGRVLKLTDQLILDLARVGAAVSAGFGGGGLEGAQIYEEIRRRGGSHDQAAKGAILMWLASTGLNTLSFTKMFGRPGAGPFGRVKHVAGAGFTEAGTEALEEPSEALILGDNMLKALKEEGVDVAVPSFITGGFGAALAGRRAEGGARGQRSDIGPPQPIDPRLLALEAFLRQNDPALTQGQTPAETQESGRQAALKALERERPQFVPAPETAGVPEPAPPPPAPAPTFRAGDRVRNIQTDALGTVSTAGDMTFWVRWDKGGPLDGQTTIMERSKAAGTLEMAPAEGAAAPPVEPAPPVAPPVAPEPPEAAPEPTPAPPVVPAPEGPAEGEEEAPKAPAVAPKVEPPAPAPPVVKPPEAPVFRARLYQGRGASPEEVYGAANVKAGRGHPLVGPGDYYAFEERDAKRYGAVTTHAVELRTPYVLTSDRQWFELLRAADARQLSSVDRAQGPTEAAAQKLQDYLVAQGHDGLVARFPSAAEGDVSETGDVIKRVRESFEHSTVVKFGVPGAPTTTPAPPVEPPPVKPPEPPRAPSLVTAPLAGPEGSATSTRTLAGTEIPGTWRVANLGDLVTSHTPDGRAIDEYPAELQQRDRSRIASLAQVTDTASKFDPTLVGESRLASDGAPLVAGRVVVSGNNRVNALRLLYGNGAYVRQRDAYRTWLEANAERFGLDRAALAGIAEPVLVRSISAPEADLPRISQEANRPSVAAMSPQEQAVADARGMSSELLALWVPNETANVNSTANAEFRRTFLRHFADAGERGRYINAEGGVTPEFITRIKNAFFARAYGARAVGRLTEATDDNARNITSALMNAAPRLVALRDQAERGALYPLDITPDLASALGTLSYLRDQGMPIETYLAQGVLGEDPLTPVAKELLSLFGKHARSAKRLTDILMRYAQGWEQEGHPQQASLLGDAPAPRIEDVLDAAVTATGGRNVEGPTTQQPGLLPERPEGGGAGPAAPGAEGAGAPEGGPATGAPGPAGGVAPGPRAVSAGAKQAAIDRARGRLGRPAPPPRGVAETTRTYAVNDPARDADLLVDLFIVGQAEYEAGATDRATWIERMRGDLGDEVQPHLDYLWELIDAGRELAQEVPHGKPTPAPVAGEAGGESPRGGPGGVADLRRAGGVDVGQRHLIVARPEQTHRVEIERAPAALRSALTDEQLQAAEKSIRALEDPGAFLLADGTGAGKTRVILATASYFAAQGHPVVVIAPASVLKLQTVKGQRRVSGSYADDSAAMKVPVSVWWDGPIAPGRIYVTTYEKSKALPAVENAVLVFDEAHALKNADSARALAGMALARHARAVLFSTATPVDRPLHLDYLIRSGLFGDRTAESVYREIGMRQRSITVRTKSGASFQKMIWEIDPNVGEEAVFRRMRALFDGLTERSGMIKREVDMADVDVTFLPIPLPPGARETAQRITDGLSRGGVPEGLRKAVILMHIRRQMEPYKIPLAALAAKRELDEGRQVVLFISRVNYSEAVLKQKLYGFGGEVVDEIKHILAASEGSAGTLRRAVEALGITDIAELHGEAEEKASEAMEAFQSGRARVLIATPESGGIGINLDDRAGDRPRTVVMITAPFTATDTVQALGRVNRMTTKSDVRSIFLHSDMPIDAWNLGIVASKLKALRATVRGGVEQIVPPEDTTGVSERRRGRYTAGRGSGQQALPGAEVDEGRPGEAAQLPLGVAAEERAPSDLTGRPLDEVVRILGAAPEGASFTLGNTTLTMQRDRSGKLAPFQPGRFLVDRPRLESLIQRAGAAPEMKTERTAFGDQGLIPGAEGRTIPTSKIASEQAQRPIETTPLFGQEKAARDRESDEAQGRLFAPVKTSGTTGIAINERGGRVLAGSMYGGQVPSIAVKEGVQNSIDSLRTLRDPSKGVIRVDFDSRANKLTIEDNGAGMSKDVATTELMEIGESDKPAEGSSGAFGLAKAVLFGHAKSLDIVTRSAAARESERQPSLFGTLMGRASRAAAGRGRIVETRLTGTGSDWLNRRLSWTSDDDAPSGPTGTTVMVEFEDDVPKGDAYAVRNWIREFLETVRFPARYEFTVDREVFNTKDVAAKVRHVETLTAPGASVDVLVSDDTVDTRYPTIRVLNNGIPQFQIMSSLRREMPMPRLIVADVHASVPATSLEYPFASNRETLKGAAQRAINEYVNTKLAVDAAMAERQRFTKLLDAAPALGKSDLKLVDGTGIIDKAFVKELAVAPSTRQVAEAVGRVFTRLQAALASGDPRFARAEYTGAILHGDWLGVNLLGEAFHGPGGNNLVFFNPFLLAQSIQNEVAAGGFSAAQAPRRFAQSAAHVMLHELTHQGARSEDADFTAALRQNDGNTFDLRVQLTNELAAYMEEGGGFRYRATAKFGEDLALRYGGGRGVFGQIGAHALAPRGERDADVAGAGTGRGPGREVPLRPERGAAADREPADLGRGEAPGVGEPTTPYSAVPGRPELVGPAETFKHGEREPVDAAFYYHVTTAAAARRIIREGFVPGRRQTMAEGAYRDLARGKVFLTDRQGVGYWRDRIEEHLEHQYDNPPKLVVVRVSRDAVSVESDPNRAWNEPASWVIAGEARRVEESITPYSALPPDEALIRRAERHYGVTEDWREAGYVLSDGTMLDFSGRHYSSGYERKPGAIRSTPVRGHQDYLGGQRNVDHREDLSVVMPEFAPGAGAAPEGRRMRTFMDRAGAVRFHPSLPGLDFGAVLPTDAQLRVAIRAARETREPLVIDGPDRQSWTFDRPTLDAVREALDEARRVEEPTTRYTRRSDATEADDRGAQQAFDFLDEVARRPVSSLRGDVLGRGPTGVPRTLGVAFDVARINQELRETGTVDFRGKVIDSPEAYALAAQILRNPLFETARFHFTDDAGRVVYQESYTSRLPNTVAVFVTHDMAGELRAMWARAQAHGATKVWVTHNHPTGDPTASGADLELTAVVGEHMPLQGHVITDGTTYAFVAPDRTISVRDVPGVTEDVLLRSAVPHRLLGRRIGHDRDLANLGRELKVREGWAAAFQIGADQRIRGIQELPIADLVDLDKAVPYLKESRAGFGAIETMLWTTAKDPKLAWNGQFLIRQGAIADYGWTGGTAVVELLVHPGAGAMLEEAAQLRERPGPAIRVEEGLPAEPTREQPRDEAGRFVAEERVPYVPDAEARRRGGRLLEAVRALPDTAQASQILRALRAAGVSDQALQASGLQGFLKFREGQRVSRDALGHFLQAPESVVPDLAEVGRVLAAPDYETWATKMTVLVGEWARPHLPTAWAHMRGETTPGELPTGAIDAEAGTLREIEGLVTDAAPGATVQVGDETFTRRPNAIFPWVPAEEGGQPLSTPALLGRIRDRRASLGYAPGPAAPPVAAPGAATPATGPGSPASFKLMSRIAEIMDIPVRVGRMRQGRSVLGIFKAPPPVPGGKVPDVIRLRTAEDIQTLAHEVGHYVSRLLWGSQWPGRRPSPRQLARRVFYRTHEAELMALAAAHRKPSTEEGFAEFWRLYLTREAQARTSAPTLYGVLEAEVGRHDPALLAALRNIRDWYVAWRSMEPSERVRAHIMSSREVDREREDARLDMFSIVEQAMDRYAKVFAATETMTKGAALPAERDPRILIRALSGAPRLVDLFLFKGRTNLPEVFVKMFGASKGGGGALDFATRRRAGPSLEEALEPVRTRVDDWKVYMIARRVQELFRRRDDRAVRQRESLMRAWEMQEADVNGIVAKYDSAEFRQAHDTYQEWNRAVLAYVRDSGLLAGEVTVRDPAGGPSRTMSLYDLITDLNQSHFPFHRFFEERAEIGVPAGGKLTNVQQPVRAMTGSGRLFLDPLDTAVRNLYVMVMSAERHAVVRAFVDIAERTEGGGRWFERVPPESRVTSFPVEEIRRQLEAAGVDPAALNNADLEAVLRVFRPDAYKTRENEEWVIGPNGRPVHYIVEPNLHRALTGMNVGDVSWLDEALGQLPAPRLRELFAIFREGEVGKGLRGTLLNRKLWEALLFGPARLRRAGATLAPEFQGRNVLRDTFDRAMLSQVTAKGKVPVVWPFADMVRAIAGVPKGLLSAIRHDEWYEARLRGGGEIASLPSLDLYDIQRRIDDVLTGRDGADWHTVYHPVQLARLIGTTLEDVNRIAETRDVMEARGQRGTTASKSEMLVGGTASREGTVDFNMIGAMTKRLAINRLAAFFNANIQGNYRTYRAFRADPGRMAWFAFMTITLPSLLLWWAEHDDPRWAEIPQWQKDNSWIYLTGAVTEAQYAKMSKEQRRALMRQTVWRVPKPWLPGVVFGSVPERILDWAYGHTPRTLVESLTRTLGVAASMSLVPTPTMLEPILDNMVDYMSFFGRPVEGRGMKEKEASYRVRPHTSHVARWIAGGFDAANEAARSTAGTKPVPEMLRSPLQVDHLLQSLGGGLERLGAEVVDWTVDFFDKNAPPKPERTWADIPGIRAFAVRFPTTQSESIDKFYDIYTDAQQAVATYRPMVGPKKPKAGAPPVPERLAEQAEGYERRRAALLLVAPALAKVAETLSSRRKEIQAIYDDKTKAPSIKRAEIEELVMDMIEAASDGVRQARDVERAVAAGARGGP